MVFSPIYIMAYDDVFDKPTFAEEVALGLKHSQGPPAPQAHWERLGQWPQMAMREHLQRPGQRAFSNGQGLHDDSALDCR